MPFVLFDSEAGAYIRRPHAARFAAGLHEAKRWTRFADARAAAEGLNTPRVVPPGRRPDHTYADRPQVEVHELDATGAHVATHPAPPVHLALDSRTGTLRPV